MDQILIIQIKVMRVFFLRFNWCHGRCLSAFPPILSVRGNRLWAALRSDSFTFYLSSRRRHLSAIRACSIANKHQNTVRCLVPWINQSSRVTCPFFIANRQQNPLCAMSSRKWTHSLGNAPSCLICFSFQNLNPCFTVAIKIK